MSLFAEISDPTDLAAVRRVIGAAPRPAALVPLGIDRLVIDADAALEVDEELAAQFARRDLTGTGARVLLLVDATPIHRDGTDLKELVRHRLLARGFAVETLVLGDERHSLHADDDALALAAERARGVDAVVSVGSGTISDIAKVATSDERAVPLVVVQTAASVDGYTDNVSVILRSGAKRTVPSRWPDAVLADVTTIRTAPARLNTSGFGEVLSLFTAPSDWWLAHEVGLDDSYHETPRDLLLAYAGDPGHWGEGLTTGAPDAVAQLTRVLAIRGIGTGIAGTTACLSGVEHLVSHLLDMHAAARGLETGLHGAQVGVASLVAAAAWEHLERRLAAEPGVVRAPNPVTAERAVRAAFDRLDASGRLSAECWADCERKLAALAERLPRIQHVVDALPGALRAGAIARPSVDGLAAALRRAGAAATPVEATAWVTDDEWAWAVANCHRMRDRFTVVDLLDLLGWWGPSDIERVLDRAREAVEGVRA